MSGPCTAGYFIVQGILVLSAEAMREARAMRREYGEVLAQLERREREREQARQAQRDARLERLATVRASAGRLEARLARLRSLAQAAGVPAAGGTAPTPATDAGDDAWSEHVRALESSVRGIEAMLAQARGTAAESIRKALASAPATPGIDDVLGAYVLQRNLQPGLSRAETERFRQTAARVLARLDLAADDPLPVAFEALAREIVLAPTVERAEALATELRLAVQRHRDAREAQRFEREEAKAALAALADDAPPPLLRALERVAAGVDRLDDVLRTAAERAMATATADREAREQEAAAQVLQGSLRDLGYEVEDIGATLFVDGGAVHFRRKGWDSYFVRLRVDTRERTVNFNVVRAGGDEENAERRRQDALAEDRWCAEFPRLMETLAARGLRLSVTRRLGAGEVPVQVVDPAALPAIAAEDEPGARPAPAARELR